MKPFDIRFTNSYFCMTPITCTYLTFKSNIFFTYIGFLPFILTLYRTKFLFAFFTSFKYIITNRTSSIFKNKLTFIIFMTGITTKMMFCTIVLCFCLIYLFPTIFAINGISCSLPFYWYINHSFIFIFSLYIFSFYITTYKSLLGLVHFWILTDIATFIFITLL